MIVSGWKSTASERDPVHSLGFRKLAAYDRECNFGSIRKKGFDPALHEFPFRMS